MRAEPTQRTLTSDGCVENPKNSADARKPLSGLARIAVVGAIGGAILAAMAVPVVAGIGKASDVAAEQIGALPAELATTAAAGAHDHGGRRRQPDRDAFDENRIEVPPEEDQPQHAKAVIAVEDQRFYEHRGVDIQGLIRAQLENTPAVPFSRARRP